MRPVSAAFNSAVRGPHAMKARARVVDPGQVGTDPTGTEIPILGGDVTYDSTADIRATLDLTTDGTGWDPRVGRDALQPYGNELFVERGITLTSGSTEWVSQGYYRIWDVGQDNAPNGPLRISGRDRMSAIVDAKLLAPVQFSAAVAVSAIFDQLVHEVLPAAVIDFTADDRVLGRAQHADEDRHGFLKDLADSIGAVMYFDYRGHLVIKPVPDPTMPVFTVNAGDGGVLVSASRSLSRDQVYNAVVATGEGTDDKHPVRAVAYDNNPMSPTYWFGDFGQVPEFFSSPSLTTNPQASLAASARLLKSIGLPYNIDFSAVPHPGLEDRDVVRLEYPGFYDQQILDKLTIPLTASGEMTGTSRQATLINIGVI